MLIEKCSFRYLVNSVQNQAQSTNLRLGDRTVVRDRRVGHACYSVLCNVFIPTHNALEFKHALQ